MHVVECLSRSIIGGGQSVVYTLVRQLRVQHPEVQLTVVLPPGGVFVDRFRSLGVDVLEIRFDSLSPFRPTQVSRQLRMLQPDVVHSHGKGAGLYVRLLPLGRVRHIHSFHGFHPPDRRLLSTLYQTAESFLLSRTDTVIAVSEEEAQEIRSTFKRIDSRVIAIPNAVDCSKLSECGESALPPEMDAFLARNSGRFIVTMIGRNDPVKNYALAFAATRLILRGGLRCSFVFVGIDEDDRLYTELLREYPGHVHAIPYLENPAPLIKQSSAVMLTSRKEGSPLVVGEAFCFGKPVIGTDVPGIRQAVEHGVNGLLCAETEEAVAHAVHMLAADTQLYARLSEGARVAASSHNIQTWADDYYAVYSGKDA